VCIEAGARLKLGTNTKLSDYATIPDLLREIHAVHEVLEARVRAQTIHPEVGPQEVRKVGRFSWYAFSRNSKALSLSPNPA
jgi:hypothetical protein